MGSELTSHVESNDWIVAFATEAGEAENEAEDELYVAGRPVLNRIN